jgi:hypothetical protein
MYIKHIKNYLGLIDNLFVSLFLRVFSLNLEFLFFRMTDNFGIKAIDGKPNIEP